MRSLPDSMDWRVNVLGSVSSTQDLVKEFADRGEEEGFAVQALTMTNGRGRQGNEWDAPMGNLYLSFLLRPECSLNEAGQLAFVVALALSEAIDLYMDKNRQKTLKWPNDILIDGKKMCGILLESQTRVDGSLEYIVVGCGVNIMAPPEGRAGLQEAAQSRVAINVFRDDFLACMKVAYQGWQEKVIGTNTVEAMRSGLYWGYISMIEGVLKRISGELGQKPLVIATGGLASIYADGCDMIDVVDETLTLKGMIRLHDLQGKRAKAA